MGYGHSSINGPRSGDLMSCAVIVRRATKRVGSQPKLAAWAICSRCGAKGPRDDRDDRVHGADAQAGRRARAGRTWRQQLQRTGWSRARRVVVVRRRLCEARRVWAKPGDGAALQAHLLRWLSARALTLNEEKTRRVEQRGTHRFVFLALPSHGGKDGRANAGTRMSNPVQRANVNFGTKCEPS